MEYAPDRTAETIVPVLACVLDQLCERNDQLNAQQTPVPTKFDALR
jgi:hypothetical protein